MGQPLLAVLILYRQRSFRPVHNFAAPAFCTPMHKFAQISRQTPLDVINRKEYCARQIEPEALELYGSVQKAQQPNGGCAQDRTEKLAG